MLDSEFGSGEIPTVTLSTANAPGLVRRDVRRSDIVEEVSSARIWGGIHWRADQEFGEDPGRRVGRLALETQLRPAR